MRTSIFAVLEDLDMVGEEADPTLDVVEITQTSELMSSYAEDVQTQSDQIELGIEVAVAVEELKAAIAAIAPSNFSLENFSYAHAALQANARALGGTMVPAAVTESTDSVTLSSIAIESSDGLLSKISAAIKAGIAKLKELLKRAYQFFFQNIDRFEAKFKDIKAKVEKGELIPSGEDVTNKAHLNTFSILRASNLKTTLQKAASMYDNLRNYCSDFLCANDNEARIKALRELNLEFSNKYFSYDITVPGAQMYFDTKLTSAGIKNELSTDPREFIGELRSRKVEIWRTGSRGYRWSTDNTSERAMDINAIKHILNDIDAAISLGGQYRKLEREADNALRQIEAKLSNFKDLEVLEYRLTQSDFFGIAKNLMIDPAAMLAKLAYIGCSESLQYVVANLKKA